LKLIKIKTEYSKDISAIKLVGKEKMMQ